MLVRSDTDVVAVQTLAPRARSSALALFIIYIKEAHPEDGWALTYNWRSGIALKDPQSKPERTDVAKSCALRMRTSIPVLIDEIDNEVARQYGGWPDRLYLIGKDGRIAFQGTEGPFGFKPEQLDEVKSQHVVYRHENGRWSRWFVRGAS